MEALFFARHLINLRSSAWSPPTERWGQGEGEWLSVFNVFIFIFLSSSILYFRTKYPVSCLC